MEKWKNTQYSFSERTKDLVSKMTTEEKISQTVFKSSALSRFGIQEYNWWNECLHGVARAGIATVFPQAIGMAASYNTSLMGDVARVISDEARAKHHEAKRNGNNSMYKGLTFWSPNVNIFRDPRWGRGQETYGEDPYLSSRMGVEFIRGLQGDDERYLKLVGTAKHFAVHSGPEESRHEFDAVVSQQDLYETYLPAFEACVREANVYSIMGAYNRTNGEPCCGSRTLLDDILRGEWGFDGIVVSDCGAIEDFHAHHGVTNTPAESAALALNNGCEINCGWIFSHLLQAVEDGLVTRETLDRATYRVMLARMRLGMFDPEEMVPYASIPYEVNDCQEHHDICRQMTAESIVLLKNDKILPVDRKKIKTIAVVGPNANDVAALLGNYSGEASTHSTILDGIRMAHPMAEIIYAKGCNVSGVADDNVWGQSEYDQIWEAVAAAQRADLVIIATGLNANLEGEESPTNMLKQYIDMDKLPFAIPSFGGDREDISLPPPQIALVEDVCAVGKPTVLLNLTGSCVDLSPFADSCDAIMQCWYPGQFGGEVIARMIFGEYVPCGKLPVTFYRDISDLPDFSDYSMDNRTYKYYTGEALYPFGYGLSYSPVEYYRIYLDRPSIEAGEDIEVTVSIKNIGKYPTKEVVQVYLVDEESSQRTPLSRLVAFQKVDLPDDKEVKTTLTIHAKEMALINKEGASIIESGRFSIYVGGGQPDSITERLYQRDSLHIGFLVE